MQHAGYRDLPGVNWSTLKHLRVSPLHYRYAIENPREDSDALAIGRLTHALVFEPDTVALNYAIWTGDQRRGKEWNAFKAEHEGITIVKADDVDNATAMAEAVRRHPLVRPYLDGGRFERPIQWVDRKTGIPCKGLLDWHHSRRRALVDLKTTRTIDAHRFGNIAHALGYPGQLAHYFDGLETLGERPIEVMIVAVENVAPFDVAVFELDDEALQYGLDERDRLLATLAECMASDVWPGRYTERRALKLPGWLFVDEDDENPDTFGVHFGEAS